MARARTWVSPTAHFTAQAWVRGGFPESTPFDTLSGRVLFEPVSRVVEGLGVRAPSLPWLLQFLWIRHSAFEQRLRQLAPDLIVEVGAGLSGRGLSMAAERPDLIYCEVDLPSVVRTKQRLLARASVPPNYLLREGDITGSTLLDPQTEALLTSRTRPARRVAVVTEGLIDYLSPQEKRKAMENVSAFLRAHGGGSYLFEAHTKARLKKYPVTAGALLSLFSVLSRERFSRRLFDEASDVIELARASGFTRCHTLDVEGYNATEYHPPPDYCYFELLEAAV